MEIFFRGNKREVYKEMVENILVMEQDIYTLSPIVFAGLVALMFTTGKWRMYPIATLYLFTLTIALFYVYSVGKIRREPYTS